MKSPRVVYMEFTRRDLILIRHAIFMLDATSDLKRKHQLTERFSEEIHRVSAMSDTTKEKLREIGKRNWLNRKAHQ